jgi:Holliday junction DNA helicase RuvA
MVWRMITFVKGILIEKQPTRVVLEVSGLGYELLIPLSSYDRLPSTGDQVCLLTVDHVREDAHILYGFMTEGERQLFGMLTSVSGIGPKSALSALSGMTVRELKAAVAEGNVKRISSVPGIGAKTAERIIVELRHKLSAGEALEAVAGSEDGDDPLNTGLRDALLALVALGYKQDDARKMILAVSKKHPDVVDVEKLIKIALSK